MLRASVRANYRLLVAEQLAQFVLIPIGLAYCAILFLRPQSAWIRLATYGASVPAFMAVRIHLVHWKQAREARRLGAQLVPAVQGKWPGNIDVFNVLMRDYQEGYATLYFLPLFEQYRTKTLNLRILWTDLVRPRLRARLGDSVCTM